MYNLLQPYIADFFQLFSYDKTASHILIHYKINILPSMVYCNSRIFSSDIYFWMIDPYLSGKLQQSTVTQLY